MEKQSQSQQNNGENNKSQQNNGENNKSQQNNGENNKPKKVEKPKTKSQRQPCTICYTYYAGKETNWMCSGCFKKHKELEEKEKNKAKEESKEQSKMEEEKEEEDDKPKRPIQKKKKRCWKCNKKIGIVKAFKCKCDYIFCGKHRHPNQQNNKHDDKDKGHDCDFDFVIDDLRKLKVKLPDLEIKKVNSDFRDFKKA